jgi:hypothetical protein
MAGMKKSPTHKTKRTSPVSSDQTAVTNKSRPGNKDNPFAAARRDHSSETAEDYVEAVAQITAQSGHCRVIDLARTFAVSSVTVNRTIARLKRDGWVDVEPYGPVLLTDTGKQLAERCRLRHETVLNFCFPSAFPQKPLKSMRKESSITAAQKHCRPWTGTSRKMRPNRKSQRRPAIPSGAKLPKATFRSEFRFLARQADRPAVSLSAFPASCPR